MDNSSPQVRIWQVVSLVPAGAVVTYGQVARMAGLPQHARMVGSVLRQLPRGTNIPWHRVINSQGRISFPAGSAQYQRQQALLLEEGIEFIGDRVPLRRFQWQGGFEN
ncbi:MGMT family protein [Aestuariirhabdus litorea]|uniref:Methylated-DNA--[protein]-cysteine S-methyltransferase n=1 Tax=Aestuariirhabdus litorea TaxID=2528527 RepID=A0A3P3VKU3_9GAMM|nr:methylated-DNA--[protein]-cysteine S-methyltransferase [Aestuariirhabdus litorea]RRJ83310.1 methylated-DNA--[protein]-cysteine S-methyltransferase [Aestuariirhabdus litorea]RWW93470.1 methylated-DNA--[protein]-cysteine S-methyltransferase [Endozoicomonadaceae bacterium GTF-13]